MSKRSTSTRGIVIAGTHSGVGKTTVSTALMAAYQRRGLNVQGFKVGPDFIDPRYHQAATGHPSRNLDGWMLSREAVRGLFKQAAMKADISVVEGVMGLFDGASALDERGSTAEMAKWLGLPVVLIIDAEALARSAGALVLGFEAFDVNVPPAGVIANKIAGPGHYRYVEDAIRASCKAEPLGWLPRDPSIHIPSRHLGLAMPDETMNETMIALLADRVERGVNLDRLLELSSTIIECQPYAAPPSLPVGSSDTVKIGIARDAAFCFYYQDNLELLEHLGAELVPWSPIGGDLPQGLQGLYFGGGYPELFASELSANSHMRERIQRFILGGGPVYAECGGLMYMAEAIVDMSGSEFPMVGVLPAKSIMRDGIAALGYCEVEGVNDNELLPEGQSIRGHQFRYSDMDPVPLTVKRQYRVKGCGNSEGAILEGYSIRNCLASYVHLHFHSNAGFAIRWLDLCRRSNACT